MIVDGAGVVDSQCKRLKNILKKKIFWRLDESLWCSKNYFEYIKAQIDFLSLIRVEKYHFFEKIRSFRDKNIRFCEENNNEIICLSIFYSSVYKSFS